MTTAKLLSIVLAGASLVGACATAPEGTGDPGGDGGGGGGTGGGGGGGGGGGSGGGAQPLDASGNYGMQSTFDLSSNMPGAVGDVVNQFIDATDGPNDPTQWLMDLIVAQMPSGTIKSLLQAGEPLVVGYLNQQVLSWAPDFVDTFLRIGNDFGDMAKHTGLNSNLGVTKASGGGYTSVHTVTGAHFVVEGTASDFTFTDYGVQNVVVPNVAVTCDQGGNLTIAEQQVPLSYGTVLHMGLDGAVIPLVDPNAADLQTLLADKIDCGQVGQYIADEIGFGDPSLYAGACTAGLNAGASFIYSKIDGIDSSVLLFDMTGAAKATSSSGNGKVDTIAGGAWSGTLSYAGTPAPLSTATFTGTRQ